jgi:hypothetical protein
MGRASGLGVIGILFGILLASWHANEFMKFLIVAEPPYTVATMPEPDCEEDELEEEGLTLEECRQLAFAVHDISISSPGWFKSFHVALSAVGAVLALLSVIVGIALVDHRTWASGAAVSAFGALAVLDIVSFTAVVNTGPLIRQMYLWSILLWFFIHLAMTVGAVVQRQGRQSVPSPSAT